MAMRVFVYVVGILFCTALNKVDGEPVSFYTFYKEIRVGQFSNFGSLQLIDLNVPPLTVSLICQVRGSQTPSSCPLRNINIYWQYGSIPVAEYHGKATFPKDFILRRSYLNSTLVPSNGSLGRLRLENPIPGTWFLAAFVEKKDDQIIKKITNVDCSYGIQVNVTTILTSAVSEIEAEKSLKLRLNSSENLFRFFVTGDVYKYSVSLSCANKSRCPVLLSARASGLPSNGNETVNVNCTSTDSSTCLLNFVSPAVDQWHYLQIACLQNHTEDVVLFIHISACGRETRAEPTKRTLSFTRTAASPSSPTSFSPRPPTSNDVLIPDPSASISTLTPNPSAAISTLTPNPSAAISTLTPNPSASISTLTPNLSAAISTLTPNPSASISTLTPNPSASISTLTPNSTAANTSSSLTSNPAASNSTLILSSAAVKDNLTRNLNAVIGTVTESQSVINITQMPDTAARIMPHNDIANSVTPDVNSTLNNPMSGALLVTPENEFTKVDWKRSLLLSLSWNKTSHVEKNFPAAANHLRFVTSGKLPDGLKTIDPLNGVWNSLPSSPLCLSPVRFSQIVDVDNTLSTIFSAQPMSAETLVIATREMPYLMRFDLHPIRDIGATLKIHAELHEVLETLSRDDGQENVFMKVCIQRNSIPINDALELSCLTREDFFLVTPRNQSLLRWYPYPEPGPWFIGIQKFCYNNMSLRVPCHKTGAMSFKVMTTPCIDDSCSNTGYCVEYGRSVYTYAACQCTAGYRGYACDDDTEAASNSLQMAFSFFLSMSNLLFIPAIGVACWRRRYPEALVYSANMLFSSFYHACDMSTWSRYKLCIMPYHVLSFCDFYCSMLSFWVTLTAMARLPVMLRSVAHMAGAVALAMAMKWNMHGVITNIVPIAVGAGMVIISWAVRCGQLRRLFPQKKSLLWTIPGVALAGFGICLFAFVETDANYPYTHSVWHVCMAVSIIFLLPRSKVQMKDESSADTSSFCVEDLNDTSELIVDDFNRLL